MNCFSHARRFLDRDPYFIVGTCVPDWLSLVARKTRVREKAANQFVNDPESPLANLAAGIVRHHKDDHWFHSQRDFVELNLKFAIELRELLGADAGFRPHLVGHILIEVLLDSYLTEQNRSMLDLYYDHVASVDPMIVEKSINRIAATRTDRIIKFIPRFIEEGYLYDYVDDKRVRYRLNRVLAHVKLSGLPVTFLDWMPGARQQVYDKAETMLPLTSG